MEKAIGFIDSSGLNQDEKDTLGGILLADPSLAAGINLLHTDGALRSLIQQKQGIGVINVCGCIFLQNFCNLN